MTTFRASVCFIAVLTKYDISILGIQHYQRRHSALLDDLCINHHRRQDLRRLRGAEVVAGPVVAAGGLEPGAARRNHARRPVVHLVEHRALDDVDGDGGTAVGVRRRRGIRREVDEEADGHLSGRVGQLVLEDGGDVGEGTAIWWRVSWVYMQCYAWNAMEEMERHEDEVGDGWRTLPSLVWHVVNDLVFLGLIHCCGLEMVVTCQLVNVEPTQIKAIKPKHIGAIYTLSRLH